MGTKVEVYYFCSLLEANLTTFLFVQTKKHQQKFLNRQRKKRNRYGRNATIC